MAADLPWTWVKPVAGLALIAAGLIAGQAACMATDERSADPQHPASADSSLYLKVKLAYPVRMAKLKPGDMVEGSLWRDVYSADRKVFPAGSSVRLTVDHLEKRRRPRNDHWPWVVSAFTPRHENYPVFKTATVAQAEGESALQVSMISVSRLREVHAQAKKDKSKQPADERGVVEANPSHGKRPATPTMVLEASAIGRPTSAAEEQDEVSSETAPFTPETLPAGTPCKVLLLGDVSASKSQTGDIVRARLLEPVLLNSKLVLPAGSRFEGKVLKKTPPRWLSRAGSLYLTFTDLTLPNGKRFPITASLAGAELDESSHTRMDAEGRLRGERPGKAWMAINLGTTAGVAKVADDGLQLVIEALVSTATDVSTAGTARIVSSCASGLYMATRHGRDVVLPRFTEMDISLDRPVSLNQPSLNRPSQTEVIGTVAGK